MTGDQNHSCSKRPGKRTRRLAKIGISDFETINEARRRQKDLLRCVKRASVDPGRYAGLADCGSGCGRINCAEACYVGTRRRRLKEIPAAYHLLKKTAGPICTVRVIRVVWARPMGGLGNVSIAAAKQLNRRALDSLYNPGLVAIGTLKVSVLVHGSRSQWIIEIHQIVAGAKGAELERVFSTTRPKGQHDRLLVRNVTDLGSAVSDVLKGDLRLFKHTMSIASASRPNIAQRTEFYEWLLGLPPNARTIRYGCDRYLNKLKKQPRTLRPKVQKKRRYPFWLVPHMFGAHPATCRCRKCLYGHLPKSDWPK
jgi:hypothetical protein